MSPSKHCSEHWFICLANRESLKKDPVNRISESARGSRKAQLARGQHEGGALA